MAHSYKRKLTAILSADVAGYSRLMGQDEAQTVQILTAYRAIMAELVQQHRGRVVDSPGDNILAEFVSVVDAVQCAVAIQNEFKVRNAELAEDRRMEFRIGVNLGDVIEEGDRIYGDGVNITARLEALADPGGICISKTTFDHIETKLPFGYEFLGEQTVKNIARPVGAYKLLMQTRVTGEKGKTKPKRRAADWNKGITAGAFAVILIIMGGLIWNFYFRQPEIEPASVEKMAQPGIEPASIDKMADRLATKPSIAVLPFKNLSDDEKQEYFSDGMTEDIITDLSKISGLMVISSNSAFTYKGKEIKIQAIAKELGVQYILEGSIRRAGNEVRINAQLIDAVSDRHIWADRFDGKNENIFDLQDSITNKIVSALSVKLSDIEQIVIAEAGTDDFFAYDEYLKGMDHMRKFTPEGYVIAIDHFKKAVEIDRNYSQAYANLAYTYMSALEGGKQFWDEIGKDFQTARLLARHYVELAMKKPTSRGYQVLARMELYKRNFDRAIDCALRAVAIAPNDADALETLGLITDNPTEAIKYYKRSIMLDPLHKSTAGIGRAYFAMGDYEQAVKYIEKALKDYPETFALYGNLAAAYALLGNDIKAKEAFKDFFT